MSTQEDRNAADELAWPDELKQILCSLIDLAARITAANSYKLLLNEVLTVDELAALLKVPASTLEELARHRKLPGAFRIGKHWRFDLDSLRAVLPKTDDDP
jgi:excisionase family DNA binding protein